MKFLIPIVFLLAGCSMPGTNAGLNHRFQLVGGGAGGPAAVFKMDTKSGELWYAYWDPLETRYRWRKIDSDTHLEELEGTQLKDASQE